MYYFVAIIMFIKYKIIFFTAHRSLHDISRLDSGVPSSI